MPSKNYLITGASGKIGQNVVKQLLQTGNKVVGQYFSNDFEIEKLLQENIDFSQNLHFIKTDLTFEINIKRLIDQTVDYFGSIDGLVNLAGKYFEGDEWNGNANAWDDTFDLNLKATMWCNRYVSELFIKQKSGVIVNIASRFGLSGSPESIAYSTSKAGLINMTQSYAKLLSPFGRCNCVSPSAVNAGYWLKADQKELVETISKTPDKRLIEPSEVADLITFLLSDKSRSINGQNIVIDQGQSVVG
jgi:3-oxoacyl-[acyl-carrier protein] reductase